MGRETQGEAEGKAKGMVVWGPAWIQCGLGCIVILWFAGPGCAGSPRLADEEEHRLTLNGYYVDSDSAFVLTGERGGSGFWHPALDPGGQIDLRPEFEGAGSRFERYRVTFDGLGRPLREGSRAVNVAPGAWFAPGDTLRVEAGSGEGARAFSVTFQKLTRFFWPVRRVENRFTFVEERRGTDGWEVAASGPLSELTPKDAIRFDHFLESRGSKPELWARLVAAPGPLLDACGGLTWVREYKGDAGSRLGLLFADSLLGRRDLRFYRNGTELRPPAGPETSTVAADSLLHYDYGLGSRRRLSLRLPKVALVDEASRTVVLDVGLEPAPSWALPPSPERPFLLGVGPDPLSNFAPLESGSSGVPFDGYHFDEVGMARPVYALAALEGPSGLRVNSGRDDRVYERGAPIRVGLLQRGVRVSVVPLRPAVPAAGLWAIVLLVLWTGALTVLARRTPTRESDLAFAVLWSLALMLLVVRFVLSYRLSLLPPRDASSGELALFHEALWYSLGALVVVPLAMLLGRYGHRPLRAPRQVGERGLRTGLGWAAVLLWLFLAACWVVVGSQVGEHQAVRGVRINIVAHLLLVLGLALLARRLVHGSTAMKVIGAAVLVVTTGLVAGVGDLVGGSGDLGFLLVYSPSFVLAILVLFGLAPPRPLHAGSSSRPGVLGRVPFGALVLGVFMVWPWVWPHAFDLPFARRVVLPNLPDTVLFRTVSLVEEDPELLAVADFGGGGVSAYRSSSGQMWQMLLYAAEGGPLGVGYGRAPTAAQGLTYPTSLSDTVYSSYLVAEHGAAAGLLTLLLYLGLSAACFYGGRLLPEAVQHRRLPLTAIGGFFGFNALYMASANLGAVVFTGQNVPLLSPASGSDVVQGAVLLGVAARLLRPDAPFWARSLPPVGSNRADRAEGVFLALLLAGALLLLLRFVGVASSERFRWDHEFLDTTSRELARNIGVNGERWGLEGRRLVPKRGVELPDLEVQLVDGFNRNANKYDPRSGVLYLRRRVGADGVARDELAFNPDYYKIESPFARGRQAWHGAVLARGNDRGHALAGGGAVSSLLDTVSGALRARSPGGGSLLYVSGRPADALRPLQPHDVLLLEERNPEGRIVGSHSAVYVGHGPSVLSAVLWRNGGYRPFYPANGLGTLAQALHRAAEATAGAGTEVPAALGLTLDAGLQRRLQDTLAAYDGPGERDPIRGRRISLAVLDAFTGEVLALPAVPHATPGTEAYQQRVDTTRGWQLERLVTNHNLTRQAVGSAFKPLLLTAVTGGLAGAFTATRMTTLDQNRGADFRRYRLLGGVRMDSEWDRSSGDHVVDAKEFLIRSENFYLGQMGILGMLIEPGPTADVLNDGGSLGLVRNARAGDYDILLDFDNRIEHRRLDLTREARSPFSLRGGHHVIGPALSETALFQMLPSFYSVRVLTGRVPPEELDSARVLLMRAEGSTFIPTLSPAERPLPDPYLKRVVPDPLVLAPGSWTSVRQHLVPFFLGDGENRWSTIRMAEAGARVVTGLRVEATLEPRAQPPSFEPLPPPLSGGAPWYNPSERWPVAKAIAWRNEHIVEPMEQVGMSGTNGTAEELSALQSGLPPGYRVLYKTGTADELRNSPNTSTLLFVLGRWDDAAASFVPGKTVAGFLYMEAAGEGANIALARRFMPVLMTYMAEREGGRTSN